MRPRGVLRVDLLLRPQRRWESHQIGMSNNLNICWNAKRNSRWPPCSPRSGETWKELRTICAWARLVKSRISRKDVSPVFCGEVSLWGTFCDAWTLIHYGSCEVEVDQNRERTFLNAYESRLYFRILHFCTFTDFSSTIMSSSSVAKCTSNAAPQINMISLPNVYQK